MGTATNFRLLAGVGAFVCLALPAAAAEGEASAPAAAQASGEIEELVVVGSRRRDRSATDSPVPVDVIDGEDFLNIGGSDMDWLLASLVPSYNVNRQPISDASTIVRPANLRGLSPDQTLVLLNGKRRHRSGVITFLGGGLADGAQGPDIASIPAIALDRVEVLRDGASAQYGSDAIAGVMNFVLKQDARGASVQTKWGQYFEGDGTSFNLAANVGMPLGDQGFANVSVEVANTDPTSRSVQRSDAAELIRAGNTDVRQPASQIWGSPEVRDDYKVFGNFGLDVGASSEVYSFANYSSRTVEGGFFFRNPNTRGGIFRGPEVDGGPTLKIADLSPSGDAGNCPVVPIVDNIPDADALAAVRDNPLCFSFTERFPGGFTPQFGGDVKDASFAIGLRGDLDSGWFYDLSFVTGSNEVRYFMQNTINPQLAHEQTNIPTSYIPGTDSEQDRVFDFTMSKPLDLGWSAPLHTAFGVEYREETFEISAGDPGSWVVTPSLAAQGFGIGSNGFPGFPPRLAGEWSRASQAAYVDLETNLSPDVLIGGAVRFERYDDFGNTLDGKFTARWQVQENFALRGAISTGFRAPTAGQSNTRKVSTVFVGVMLADQAVLPPTHPISVQKGGEALEPEESVNVTFGAVFDIGDMVVTADYYNITTDNRIAQSSQLLLTDEDIAALLAQGVTDATSFSSVTFFTNDFDTTTQGIDIVATMPLDLGAGATNLSLALNWNDTQVDSFSADLIGAGRVRQLEENLPPIKLSLTGTHSVGDLRLLGRLRYYGEWFEDHLDANLLFPVENDGALLVDVEAAYTLPNGVTVMAGADNLLDMFPDENPWASIVGAQYPATSPYGFDGGFYYVRLTYDID